jgi:hypothetical protein
MAELTASTQTTPIGRQQGLLAEVERLRPELDCAAVNVGLETQSVLQKRETNARSKIERP